MMVMGHLIASLNGHWVAKEPPPPAGINLTGQHPNDLAQNINLKHVVAGLRETGRCGKTQKANDPKTMEIFCFCDLCYPDDPYKYILTCEKVYRFMWYQCFCERKKSGGNREAIACGEYFDLEAYKELMRHYKVGPGHAQMVYPSPKKPIGACTFNQYKAVLCKINKCRRWSMYCFCTGMISGR